MSAGDHLGYSDWLEIDQDRVNRFAEVTGDDQWIHIDPERAAASRYGGTIAQGYLILSLTPSLLPQVLARSPVGDDVAMSVNQGCDRVRFLTPVRVGSFLRLGVTLDETTDIRDGRQFVFGLTFQVQGTRVPACVAKATIRDYR